VPREGGTLTMLLDCHHGHRAASCEDRDRVGLPQLHDRRRQPQRRARGKHAHQHGHDADEDLRWAGQVSGEILYNSMRSVRECINAPEECPHGTNTSRTAYTRGTHSKDVPPIAAHACVLSTSFYFVRRCCSPAAACRSSPRGSGRARKSRSRPGATRSSPTSGGTSSGSTCAGRRQRAAR
jgi:hypothetical protein